MNQLPVEPENNQLPIESVVEKSRKRRNIKYVMAVHTALRFSKYVILASLLVVVVNGVKQHYINYKTVTEQKKKIEQVPNRVTEKLAIIHKDTGRMVDVNQIYMIKTEETGLSLYELQKIIYQSGKKVVSFRSFEDGQTITYDEAKQTVTKQGVISKVILLDQMFYRFYQMNDIGTLEQYIKLKVSQSEHYGLKETIVYLPNKELTLYL